MRQEDKKSGIGSVGRRIKGKEIRYKKILYSYDVSIPAVPTEMTSQS